MGFNRFYQFLLVGGQAYARWDLSVSTRILKSRKKLLFILALAAPIFILCVAEAYHQPEMLGGHSAYGPAFFTTRIFLASIGIGLMAGLITGVIGAGGGFIITPALMAIGVKGILAVGTDLFHIFAKAIMGSAIHGKMGNISIKLAAIFLVGSIGGTFVGGSINKSLYQTNPLLSDVFISIIYALLLGFLGIYSLVDFFKSQNTSPIEESPEKKDSLAQKMQKIFIPPMVSFDEKLVPGGKRISSWIIMAGGAVVGFLAAIMGVGGGFVTFPMFVYIFGVSSMTTVGTDIFQIIFTAGFAAIGEYAIYGYVFYTLAIGMLLGSLVGIQIGALTTAIVNDRYIRGFYALSILSGFINRLSALPSRLNDLEVIAWPAWLVAGIETVGNWIFWLTVAIFAIWVCGKFFANLSQLRNGNAQ